MLVHHQKAAVILARAVGLSALWARARSTRTTISPLQDASKSAILPCVAILGSVANRCRTGISAVNACSVTTLSSITLHDTLFCVTDSIS